MQIEPGKILADISSPSDIKKLDQIELVQLGQTSLVLGLETGQALLNLYLNALQAMEGVPCGHQPQVVAKRCMSGGHWPRSFCAIRSKSRGLPTSVQCSPLKGMPTTCKRASTACLSTNPIGRSPPASMVPKLPAVWSRCS